jgi:hypothetical protein
LTADIPVLIICRTGPFEKRDNNEIAVEVEIEEDGSKGGW